MRASAAASRPRGPALCWACTVLVILVWNTTAPSLRSCGWLRVGVASSGTTHSSPSVDFSLANVNEKIKVTSNKISCSRSCKGIEMASCIFQATLRGPHLIIVSLCTAHACPRQGGGQCLLAARFHTWGAASAQDSPQTRPYKPGDIIPWQKVYTLYTLHP